MGKIACPCGETVTSYDNGLLFAEDVTADPIAVWGCRACGRINVPRTGGKSVWYVPEEKIADEDGQAWLPWDD